MKHNRFGCRHPPQDYCASLMQERNLDLDVELEPHISCAAKVTVLFDPGNGRGNIMLDRIARLFRPEDAQKKASLALARLISQHNLETLPFREGVAPTRRKSDSQQVAVGVWLIPCEINAKDTVINFSAASPAITYDLRRSGIGILSREIMKGSHVVVAMPDMESVWRFFECKIMHQSKRPGGWHLIGLFVQRIVEADPREVTLFRQQIGDLPEKAPEPEFATRW